MKGSRVLVFSLALVTLISLLLSVSCRGTTPLTTTSLNTVPEIEYFLIDKYPDLFWCDPHLYPVARPEVEQHEAIEQYDTIKANYLEFTAILKHLNLSAKNDYTDQEKLLIYREHKTLTRVRVKP